MSLESDLQMVISLTQQGQHKKVVSAGKSAMRKYPRHPAFPNLVAVSLCNSDRQRDAIPFFQKALKLDPKYHAATKNFAQALIAIKKPEAALKLLTRLSLQSPEDADVFKLLAMANMESGLVEAAQTAADGLIQLNPDDVSAYLLRADILEYRYYLGAALADIEKALELSGENSELCIRLSLLRSRRSEHTAALQAAERAVTLSPDDPRARTNLANQLVAAGNIANAIVQYHRLLDLLPGEPEVLEQLTRIQSDPQNVDLLPTVQSAFDTASQGKPRAVLGFALAHLSRQLGDNQTSERLYKSANREMAKLTPYSARDERKFTDKIIQRFQSPLPVTRPHENQSPRPVYILGLPRSGTTLTEAIIGAHPQVMALGERHASDFLYPFVAKDLPFGPAEITRFIEQDRQQLPEAALTKAAYTDKMPENHRLVGFLLSAYPECRIIHLSRDPRDVALSMWRARFADGALNYTYDFASMAHRINLYAEIMAHWHSVYPDRIYDLTYESLVSDVKSESKRLAAFCDLDWVEEMARPDENADAVNTLTSYQIRQPVHERSVGNWWDHQDLLAEFIEKIDPRYLAKFD